MSHPLRMLLTMRLFTRHLPPIPEPPGEPLFERREIHWSAKQGWDPSLQRVRLELPEHLHDCAPYPNGGRGLWTVVAKVDQVPIGIAWSFQSAVDKRIAQLEELAVVHSWQRKGIGRQLIIESATWMAEKGYERLASMPISSEAHRLLERLGFADEGYGTRFVDILSLLNY